MTREGAELMERWSRVAARPLVHLTLTSGDARLLCGRTLSGRTDATGRVGGWHPADVRHCTRCASVAKRLDIRR